MFWNVTFIYTAFIRTTDHCKMQTAFISLFYIFINMKPSNASNSSVVVGRPRPLRHLTNFFTNFYEIFNFGKFIKIREFFCWGNEFSIYGLCWQAFARRVSFGWEERAKAWWVRTLFATYISRKRLSWRMHKARLFILDVLEQEKSTSQWLAMCIRIQRRRTV